MKEGSLLLSKPPSTDVVFSRRQRFAIVSIVAILLAVIGALLIVTAMRLLGSLSGEEKGTKYHLRRLIGSAAVDDDDDDKCFPRQCADKDDEDDYLTERKRARRRDAAAVVFFCLVVVLFGMFLNERLSELAIERRMREQERVRFELLSMEDADLGDFEATRPANSPTDESGDSQPSEPPARLLPPPVQGRDLRAEINNS